MENLVVSVEELNSILATTPFLKPYGFKVKTFATGECTVLVPFMHSLERPGGLVSGMLLMGAADVAMWLEYDDIHIAKRGENGGGKSNKKIRGKSWVHGA